MKTSRFLSAAFAAFFALSAGAETKSLVLPAGRSEAVELGFAPKGRKIIGKELVSVSMREGSTTAIITAGDAQGACQVEFVDAGGGDGLLVSVEVVGDLDDTLRALKRLLADFDDLEYVKQKSTVLVRGTISSPSDWAKFERVCSLKDFKGKVERDVEFSVDPATVNALRKKLADAGVPLVPPGKKPAEGEVAMTYEGNVLTLTGSVWSRSVLDSIRSVLKSQSWLSVVDVAKDAATSSVAQAVVSVDVDEALLELGVAFVTVSKRASHDMGSDNGIAVQAIWSGFYDFLTGEHSHNGADQFRIDASLSSTLSMLAENGVSREIQQGTLRFHANGDPGKTLHLGGTLKMTPAASGEGQAPEAQDYDYGFKIVNKQSRRIDETTAEADVEIEINGYPDFQSHGGAVTVDQQKRSVSPTVRVPLGTTVAVAGYESLLEQTKLPSGTPFLRHIPVLSWFVAKEGENLEDQALLVLVSVRKVDVESEAPMVPNTPMKDITLDAHTSNRDRDDGGRGCSPLYWFRW